MDAILGAFLLPQQDLRAQYSLRQRPSFLVRHLSRNSFHCRRFVRSFPERSFPMSNPLCFIAPLNLPTYIRKLEISYAHFLTQLPSLFR